MWRHFEPIWLLDLGLKIGPEGDKKCQKGLLRPKVQAPKLKSPYVAPVSADLASRLGGCPERGGVGGDF